MLTSQLTQLDLTVLPAKYILPLLIAGAIYLFFAHHASKQRYIPGVPIVGGHDKEAIKKSRLRFVNDSIAMLLEGYKANKNRFFYVPTKLGERLMIPVRYLEDLKTAPVDEVDFVGTFIEMFEGKYTTMGSRSTLHPRVVKAQLNQYLADVMPDVQDEIRDAFEASWPTCDDWTEVNMVERITQIVARVSSRMFGGTVLSQNDEWVQASIAFAIDGFIGAQKLKQFPEFLKPIAARFIKEIGNIEKHYKAAEKAAIPILEQRERNENEKHLDLLYWMAQQAKGSEQEKEFLAGILLKVSFAAIHTSAAAPSQLMYDLCAMPEYVEPLRDEIRAAMDDKGLISKKGFHQMSKMDSIMKESQRHNPLLLITFERIVTKDWALSDGTVIPANTTIGVPTHAISMDPEIHDEPTVFKGFRFDDTRKSSTAENVASRTAYVASNGDSMAFGYGRHACPGRFFAANEIKAIMAHLLVNYDFKFPEGKQRPVSLQVETQCLPNPTGTIMFKKRTPV